MKTTATELELVLKVDTQELGPAQIRLLKQVHTLLTQVVTAEDEAEYFETSAQLMQQMVQLIKASNFPSTQRDGIPYGEQAIEYAVDFLNEVLLSNGHVNLDN